ncbi:MAG TPA: SpoIIE family protein phosphatase [Acidimicrobiales bacterium]
MTDTPPADTTVLLVDDREENLFALSAILEPAGYKLLLARSGEEALKQLLANDVSVILLDVRMPGMDGYETARHVKQRERTSDIPIVFLTAESAEADGVLQAFSAGAVDFVTKPFEPWSLRAKVQVFADLAHKTRLLREQSELLRHQLDIQYAAETRHLRKLADAAVAINSTLSLDEMLRQLTESAREVIDTHEAETIITVEADVGLEARSRSTSAKYDAWAASEHDDSLDAMYASVIERRVPVRMANKDIAETLGARGVHGVASNHPLLQGWLAVPLIGRTGNALGLIQVADKVDGDFTDQDELVLVQLAQLAAVAIENARRYHQEHAVAHTLQRSMLPDTLPVVDGVDLAARYRAGSAGTEVGGDWYDAIELDDGRLMLVVGDVVGRGASAAAVMGQLRTGLRAYALQHFPITVLMRSLDRLLQELGKGMLATAICVVVGPSRRHLEVISAGHPPPLVLAADGTASYVACDAHTPLGILEAPVYAATTLTLAEGATLALYTDGLVEGRHRSLSEGMQKLALSASRHPAADVESLADAVLEEVVGAETGDDVALLVARLR